MVLSVARIFREPTSRDSRRRPMPNNSSSTCERYYSRASHAGRLPFLVCLPRLTTSSSTPRTRLALTYKARRLFARTHIAFSAKHCLACVSFYLAFIQFHFVLSLNITLGIKCPLNFLLIGCLRSWLPTLAPCRLEVLAYACPPRPSDAPEQ